MPHTLRTMPRETSTAAKTPIAFVNAIVGAYAARGQDAAAALQKARIAPADLTRPAARVRAAQFERLCAAAMQELDDEAPGWFSRPLPWGSYGMLARASHGAPTLGVALRRWCRHHGLLTGDVRLVLQKDGDLAEIAVTEQAPLPAALREFALLSLLRNVHGLACWWIDSGIALQQAAFPFAPPPHADVYATLFPGPLRFGAHQASLRFDARYLSQPLRRDGPALDAMLRRALPLMVLPYRRDRLLGLRLRQRLQARPAMTAEALAAELGLSVRSLHRQLTAEGSRLQQLKDEVRRTLASEMLLRGQQPIKQIAHAAGFASDKAFLRAFRGWTGQTPEQFRAAQAPPAR
ncbi:AraC family transcriptional regulator [Ottowia testudinis]|uniref:AraC family transcriptional regulator n=1 Tax=Ottowia testudinis TaxID=2816950 RepID=A0A975CGE0_9BURK|nr:AraC family transcriptional regulator [Ottowia testudinis]QTD45920.1 AraC family transcriptional regulator [Ottowia testudinis]